jgi:hypothetical protein
VSLLPQTKEIFVYLHNNAATRLRLRAARDKTLIYSGAFERHGAWVQSPAEGGKRTMYGDTTSVGVWRYVISQKKTHPQWRDKEILPDVLGRIPVSGRGHQTLLDWANELDGLEPWKENGFIVWRALSGIFAANAEGSVSFCIGSEISKETKVFAATEISVLLRNPNVDGTTKDLLAYYQRCLQTKQPLMNVGFLAR